MSDGGPRGPAQRPVDRRLAAELINLRALRVSTAEIAYLLAEHLEMSPGVVAHAVCELCRSGLVPYPTTSDSLRRSSS